MKCPCKECERSGCGPYHDQCQQYSVWKEWRQKIIREKAKDREKTELSRDHEMRYRYNLKKGWKKP